MNDLKIDTTALKLLENDFDDVLRNLANDTKFKEFKRHYERMLETLKSSHKREAELNKNCQELNDSIAENTGKIKAVLTIAEKDAQNITNLKNELLEAKGILIIQKEKDEETKKKMDKLATLNKNLETITKENQDLNSGKMNEYQVILDIRDKLERERGELENLNEMNVEELNLRKNDLEKFTNLMKKHERDFKKLDRMEIETGIQLKKNEERLLNNTGEIEKIGVERDGNLALLEDEKKNLKDLEEVFENLDGELRDLVFMKNDLEKKKVGLINFQEKQNEALEEIHAENDYLIETKEDLNKTLKIISNKHNNLRLKHGQFDRLKNKEMMDLQKLIGDLQKIEKQKSIYTNMFEDNNQKIKEIKKQSNLEKKNLQLLYNNHNNILKKYENLAIDNEGMMQKIRKVVEINKNVLNKADPLKQDIHKLEKSQTMLKCDNEKIIKEINILQTKLKKIKQELLLKDNVINEYQKKAIEAESYLLEKQKLFEAIRTDRNNYSKSLKETQDEIAEMKKTLKIINNQTDQLREEYDAKEKAVIEQIENAEKIEKECKSLDKLNEILKFKKSKRKEKITNIVNEISKLSGIKNQIDNVINQTFKKHEKIIVERDILVTSLIQKNDEIALLKERCRIQKETYKNGEKEFYKKEKELNFLNILFKDLIEELELNKKKIQKIFLYQNKIKEIDEKLREKKLKVKALSEELENPMNIKRWRSIGNDEHDIYELMSKIHQVQKKLILKTEIIISEDLKITSKNNTINNFNEILIKNPGIKEAKRFSLLQKTMRNKIRKLKAVAAELNLFRFKINDSKVKIGDIKENIDSNKKKLYELKKKRNQSLPNINK